VASESPERRLVFGQVAELYELARPSYPDELVDDVLEYAQLGPNDQILEIGAGTGKATRLFARRGPGIVAIEPSREMSAVARTTCAPYPSVTVIEAEFETWQPPVERFKLLICAQAWHWIDPALRYVKAREVLADGGLLAAFWNWPDWQAVPLRAALDEAYEETAPSLLTSGGPMNSLKPGADLRADWGAEIEATDGFDQPEVRLYEWRWRYSADQYVQLLATHSDHALLDPQTRKRLLERVRAAIEDQGGKFELPYVTRLCLARAA
jgi:SAM-dependent methyltransferase